MDNAQEIKIWLVVAEGYAEIGMGLVMLLRGGEIIYLVQRLEIAG